MKIEVERYRYWPWRYRWAVITEGSHTDHSGLAFTLSGAKRVARQMASLLKGDVIYREDY